MPDDANDWPTFEVPADVPRDEPAAQDPAAGDPNAAPPADPAGGTPPAQPPATPPAPTGGAPASPEGGEVIPKHRLDETIADRDRYRTLVETQARQIEALLQRLGTPATPPAADPNAPPAAPELTPQDRQIRERLLSVIPELSRLPEVLELLSKKDDLLGVVGDAGRWRENEQAITDQFVQTSVDTVFDRVAAFTLGEGKKGKDLNPLVQQSVVAAFSRFVASDAGRRDRYERHDLTLADEFWTAYKAAVYDPIRRDANAQLLERAGSPPAVPQGGSQTPPTPPAPRPADGIDEDTVHTNAWNRRGEFAGSR